VRHVQKPSKRLTRIRARARRFWWVSLPPIDPTKAIPWTVSICEYESKTTRRRRRRAFRRARLESAPARR